MSLSFCTANSQFLFNQIEGLLSEGAHCFPVLTMHICYKMNLACDETTLCLLLAIDKP